MNYQNFVHTDYSLKKKSSKGNYILTLSNFKNTTLNIGTPIKPSSWYESIDEYLSDKDLIDKSTGEIIIQWSNNEIVYINPDYEIKMTQTHKTTNDLREINAHNNYIKFRMGGV